MFLEALGSLNGNQGQLEKDRIEGKDILNIIDNYTYFFKNLHCLLAAKKKVYGTQTLISHSIRTDIILTDILAIPCGVREWVSKRSSAGKQNEEKAGQFPSSPESGLHSMASLISVKSFLRTSDTHSNVSTKIHFKYECFLYHVSFCINYISLIRVTISLDFIQ